MITVTSTPMMIGFVLWIVVSTFLFVRVVFHWHNAWYSRPSSQRQLDGLRRALSTWAHAYDHERQQQVLTSERHPRDEALWQECTRVGLMWIDPSEVDRDSRDFERRYTTMKKSENVSETVMAKRVAEAAVLHREVKEKTARVEELKVGIRTYALQVAEGRPENERTEKVEIESKEGTATITFSKDKVSFAKGANPRALKEVLTPATWARLFEEEVVLVDGFDEKFAALSAEDKAHVRGMIDWKKSDPSVILPK